MYQGTEGHNVREKNVLQDKQTYELQIEIKNVKSEYCR